MLMLIVTSVKIYFYYLQAYVKILESSQLLLNVVKVKSNDLASGKVRQQQQEPVKDDKKLVNVSSSTSIENLYSQLP